MKNFFKKTIVMLAILASVVTTTSFFSSPFTHAEAEGLGSCRVLLGLTSWDCNIKPNATTEGELTSNLVLIATNILNDLTIVAAYIVLGFVIYGGYQYMFSSGDVGKTAAAKRTLTNAFIGLAIVMSASIIFGAIRVALIGNNSLTDDTIKNINANELVTSLIQWVVGISGVVAAIFLVLGGVSYMTSSGDTTKLQKAKNTILYAIIGLIVVALAEIITAFVSNIIRESTDQSYFSQTIIAKELNEK